MPPTTISITTAGMPGSYHSLGLRYAERFAEHGVTLEVLPSEGSQQNLERLRATENPAELAFLQGGFGYLGTSLERRERSQIETLANIEIEGAWLFTRQRPITALAQLKGLRIAIGPVGSGSRRVALKLLEQAQIGAQDVTLSAETGRLGDRRHSGGRTNSKRIDSTCHPGRFVRRPEGLAAETVRNPANALHAAGAFGDCVFESRCRHLGRRPLC